MTYDVVAIVTGVKGKEQAGRDMFKDLVEGTKSEDGSVKYLVYEVEGADPPESLIIERFKDEAAYKAHQSSSHFQEVVKRAQSEQLLSKAMDVKKLQFVGGFESK